MEKQTQLTRQQQQKNVDELNKYDSVTSGGSGGKQLWDRGERKKVENNYWGEKKENRGR